MKHKCIFPSKAKEHNRNSWDMHCRFVNPLKMSIATVFQVKLKEILLTFAKHLVGCKCQHTFPLHLVYILLIFSINNAHPLHHPCLLASLKFLQRPTQAVHCCLVRFLQSPADDEEKSNICVASVRFFTDWLRWGKERYSSLQQSSMCE